MGDDAQIDALANEQQVNREALQSLLVELRQQAGADSFYVFWSERAGGSAGAGARPRTLVAFASPDAALVFAQRNRMVSAGRPPRVRRLSLVQLLRVMLREPSINALLLTISEDDLVPGQLPPGLLLAREAAIGRLHQSE